MSKEQHSENLGVQPNHTVTWSSRDLSETQIANQHETAFLASGGEAVVHLFEAQARATPDLSAVKFDDHQWTYRELNRQANQLARHLRGLDVVPGVAVGICLHRSLVMAVAVLGILKAGGAYVPLDAANPGQRLAYMVGDEQAAVVIHAPSQDHIPHVPGRLVCLDIDAVRLAKYPTHYPSPAPSIDRVAYVIYTPGSIGQPAGIADTRDDTRRVGVRRPAGC